MPATQNPEKLTLREGSTPSSGTSKSTSFIDLPRSSRQTVPRAARSVGQPWGNSRENQEAGQGGPSGPRPTSGAGRVALLPRWPAV